MRKTVSSHILIPLVRQAQSLPSSVDGLPIELTLTETRLDAIIDAARERYRAVEQAILDIEPDTLADMDLVFVLRPTRHIIGDDAFTPEQERRAHGMLDLVDVALVRRWAAARIMSAA